MAQVPRFRGRGMSDPFNVVGAAGVVEILLAGVAG